MIQKPELKPESEHQHQAITDMDLYTATVRTNNTVGSFGYPKDKQIIPQGG